MPDVVLHKYYFTGKHNNAGRTHISNMNLPAAVSDEDLATLITSFEELSNGDVANDATHPQLKIFSVTENVWRVKASSNVIEPYEATDSPLGLKGFITSDDASVLEGTTLSQPFIIRNIRPDFETPAGYAATGDPKEIIRQFMMNYWCVQDVDDDGSLQALGIDTVEFTRSFRMH